MEVGGGLGVTRLTNAVFLPSLLSTQGSTRMKEGQMEAKNGRNTNAELTGIDEPHYYYCFVRFLFHAMGQKRQI